MFTLLDTNNPDKKVSEDFISKRKIEMLKKILYTEFDNNTILIGYFSEPFSSLEHLYFDEYVDRINRFFSQERFDYHITVSNEEYAICHIIKNLYDDSSYGIVRISK